MHLILAQTDGVGVTELAATGSSNPTLLIVFALMAVGASFLCSLSEAAILSLPASHATFLKKKGSKVGALLEEYKSHDGIEKPLNAILTLNTIANMVGATGVGAQASQLFPGNELAMFVVSFAMTYLVLVSGELIPKKLGAVYCKPLAPFIARLIQLMVVVTRPLSVFTRPVTFVADALLHRKGAEAVATVTREQLATIAETAQHEGTLRPGEQKIISNLMNLSEVRVEDVMTPRTAVFMLPELTSVEEAMAEPRFTTFTRVPVFGENADDITGVVIKGELYEAYARGERSRQLRTFRRHLHPVFEKATLLQVLEEFSRVGHHMYQVVDEYGGTSGVITLEDVLETMIGVEIVDETDEVTDLQGLAKRSGRQSESKVDGG